MAAYLEQKDMKKLKSPVPRHQPKDARLLTWLKYGYYFTGTMKALIGICMSLLLPGSVSELENSVAPETRPLIVQMRPVEAQVDQVQDYSLYLRRAAVNHV